MGKYADKIQEQRRHLSAAAIRRNKCERSKARNDRRRTDRRMEAEERQAKWGDLALMQQIAALDRRLGKGVGARKQRSSLNKRLQSQ